MDSITSFASVACLRHRPNPSQGWRPTPMAKTLESWLETDIAAYRANPVSWLASSHFFRDPCRPNYSDLRYFFSPADGILLYQRTVKPDECILDIKGRSYSLRDALRDPGYDRESLVIGIFMTFYDVHV